MKTIFHLSLGGLEGTAQNQGIISIQVENHSKNKVKLYIQSHYLAWINTIAYI